MTTVSIISPVYRGRDSLDELTASVEGVMNRLHLDFEIVLVDDQCPENSWEKIKEIAERHDKVKGIKLSRNFGQHKAITAGLANCRGDYAVIMDCDLQDNPDYIETMLLKAKEGNDIVLTQKASRSHSFFKNFTAEIYSIIFNYLIKDKSQKYEIGEGSYSLLSRKVINAYLEIRDTHRHYLGIVRWLGFKRTKIEIKHEPRKHGESSYTFSKLIEHALDGITSQSDYLLYFSIKLAMIFFFSGVLLLGYIVVAHLLYEFKEGWASTIVAILLSTCAILLSLGVNGIYIGKSFEQSKGRPLYLIEEKTN